MRRLLVLVSLVGCAHRPEASPEVRQIDADLDEMDRKAVAGLAADIEEMQKNPARLECKVALLTGTDIIDGAQVQLSQRRATACAELLAVQDELIKTLERLRDDRQRAMLERRRARAVERDREAQASRSNAWAAAAAGLQSYSDAMRAAPPPPPTYECRNNYVGGVTCSPR
jgi:hypothetical protein